MDHLPASFFIKSRSKLQELMLPGSVVVIASNRKMHRNGDQHFPFRQSSDLYYLSGIREEMTVLVIWRGSYSDQYKEILYLPEEDPVKTRWEGPQISQEDAGANSGIIDVRVHTTLLKDLRELFENSSHVYFGTPRPGDDPESISNEAEIRRSLENETARLQEHLISPLMTRIRMFKEYEEVEMIRRAIEATGKAFIQSLSIMQPGVREYEIAAGIISEIYKSGCNDLAFEPIIASGQNALILHYTGSRGICEKGSMVLMDFGADWEYYAGDISRTIPVNGKFTKRQLELYNACHRVLNKAMKLMVPGKLMQDFHAEVGALFEEEHIKLGLYSMQDARDNRGKTPLWKEYYWHGTSHSIGLDVHDPFDHEMKFAPGMVLSCEPGLYCKEEGIGIRLENDMLITANGAENLSAGIPIDPAEIEELMHR
mgnify:CR=1 FL=1